MALEAFEPAAPQAPVVEGWGGPVRVALLTPSLLMGGAERWMISLAQRCDPRRIQWTGTALSAGAPASRDVCREMAAFMPVFADPWSGPPHEEAGIVRCPTPRAALEAAAGSADLLVTWGIAHLGRLAGGLKAALGDRPLDRVPQV